MTTGSLSEGGELRRGSILLPAGKQVHAGFDPVMPVAWVTTRQAVPDAGRVWAALSARARALTCPSPALPSISSRNSPWPGRTYLWRSPAHTLTSGSFSNVHGVSTERSVRSTLNDHTDKAES